MTKEEHTTIVKRQLVGAINTVRVVRSCIEAAAMNCEAATNQTAFHSEVQRLAVQSRELLKGLTDLHRDWSRGVQTAVIPVGMGHPVAGFRRRMFRERDQ